MAKAGKMAKYNGEISVKCGEEMKDGGENREDGKMKNGGGLEIMA
jgi:hypothetical protein